MTKFSARWRIGRLLAGADSDCVGLSASAGLQRVPLLGYQAASPGAEIQDHGDATAEAEVRCTLLVPVVDERQSVRKGGSAMSTMTHLAIKPGSSQPQFETSSDQIDWRRTCAA